jgi:hypothetical protein
MGADNPGVTYLFFFCFFWNDHDDVKQGDDVYAVCTYRSYSRSRERERERKKEGKGDKPIAFSRSLVPSLREKERIRRKKCASVFTLK